MRATGIVRRIDDLGRVVIPKEVRRALRIKEGDPLEIFTDKDGYVLLKKYSPIAELGTFAQEYVECIASTTNCVCLVCDKDTIIATAGFGAKRFFLEKNITKELEQVIYSKKTFIAQGDYAVLKLVIDNEETMKKYKAQIVVPIVTEGDIVGAVIILTEDLSFEKDGIIYQRLAETAARFLGRTLES